MTFTKLGKILMGLKKGAAANPYIAFGAAAIFGVGTLTITAYRAGRKTERELIKARAEKKEPLTRKEHMKIVAKCAAMTAVLCVATMGCIGGSMYTAHSNIKKLTAMYTAATAVIEAHEQRELVRGGTELAREIKNDILLENGLPIADEINTINRQKSEDDLLWFDLFVGKYFYATQDKIDHLKASIYHYMKDGDATCELTYLFDFLDYDHRLWPKMAEDFQFEIEDTLNGCDYADKVRIKEGTMKDVTGKAILTLDYYDICKYRGNNVSVPFSFEAM